MKTPASEFCTLPSSLANLLSSMGLYSKMSLCRALTRQSRIGEGRETTASREAKVVGNLGRQVGLEADLQTRLLELLQTRLMELLIPASSFWLQKRARKTDRSCQRLRTREIVSEGYKCIHIHVLKQRQRGTRGSLFPP